MAPELQAKDWEKIELYMKAGAKPWKIAKAFRLSNSRFRDELQNKYGEDWEQVYESYNSLGESLIEATQYQKALSGNVTMLIWLGKVRCGQKEPETVNTIPPAQPEIDKDHIIIQLQHQNTEMALKIEKLHNALEKHGNKRKAE